MRIKTIRLSWFRGAAKIAELAPQGQSLAVYGPNGAGKSSFVDAVEYVMNDGKVGHLRHDEAGRLQEKGIPNTHTPSGQQTEFTVTFMDDTQVQVKIATNGTHKKSGAQAMNMSG
jgi:chromosome segregation ATPase